MGKRLVLTNGKEITSDGKCFIIAEIGQNHQGSMGVAKTLIELAMVQYIDAFFQLQLL